MHAGNACSTTRQSREALDPAVGAPRRATVGAHAGNDLVGVAGTCYKAENRTTTERTNAPHSELPMASNTNFDSSGAKMSVYVARLPPSLLPPL